MSEIIGSGLVKVEQLNATRGLNSQINRLERENNLPVVTSRPLRVGIDISSACNIHCIFCLAEGGRMRKSADNAFRSPDLMDMYEPVLPFVEEAIFSSYEAILNPWFDQFVGRLRRFATPFKLFSNGLGVTPELSEFMLRNGMRSLWCSFHGASEKVYQSIMHGSDHGTVLGNLMALKALARRHNPAFRLTLVFCAMRRTIEELPRYVELAKRVGAAKIQVNYLLVTRPSRELEQESVFFHKELYNARVLQAKAMAQSMGIELCHQPLFGQHAAQQVAQPCYRPWEHLNVAHNGTVQVCCGGSPGLGNMREEGFTGLWNSDTMVEFRARVNSDNPPKACLACTRGRENPEEITSHLTFLRKLPAESRREHLLRLGVADANDGDCSGTGSCLVVNA